MKQKRSDSIYIDMSAIRLPLQIHENVVKTSVFFHLVSMIDKKNIVHTTLNLISEKLGYSISNIETAIKDMSQMQWVSFEKQNEIYEIFINPYIAHRTKKFFKEYVKSHKAKEAHLQEDSDDSI